MFSECKDTEYSGESLITMLHRKHDGNLRRVSFNAIETRGQVAVERFTLEQGARYLLYSIIERGRFGVRSSLHYDAKGLMAQQNISQYFACVFFGREEPVISTHSQGTRQGRTEVSMK